MREEATAAAAVGLGLGLAAGFVIGRGPTECARAAQALGASVADAARHEADLLRSCASGCRGPAEKARAVMLYASSRLTCAAAAVVERARSGGGGCSGAAAATPRAPPAPSAFSKAAAPAPSSRRGTDGSDGELALNGSCSGAGGSGALSPSASSIAGSLSGRSLSSGGGARIAPGEKLKMVRGEMAMLISLLLERRGRTGRGARRA